MATLTDLVKKIIGASPTPENIAREIARHNATRADLLREQERLKTESVASFGDRKAREKIRQRQQEIADDLRDIDAILPRLQHEHSLAASAHTKQRVAHYRAELKRAALTIESALRELISANEASVTIADQARAELGDQVACLHLPASVAFLAPAVPGAIEPWRKVLDEYFATAKPVVVPSIKPTAPKRQEVRQAARPAEVPPRRSPLKETAKPDEVLAVVVRDGYEAPSGAQCIAGDVVAIPETIFAKVLANGAVERFGGEKISGRAVA